MATNFQFNPVNGLQDKTVFPTYPANEDEARSQFQTPLNQIRDFINTNLIVNMGTWFDFKNYGGQINGNIVLGNYADTVTRCIETRRAVNGKEVLLRLGLITDGEIGASSLQFLEKSTGALLGDIQITNESLKTSKNLDLGESSSKFKNGYFSGGVNVGNGLLADSGSAIEVVGNNNNNVALVTKDNSGNVVNAVGVGTDKSFRPSTTLSNDIELGNPSGRWKDVWTGSWVRSGTGYNKLTNGMIMQWGTSTVTNNTFNTITLPIIFPVYNAKVFTTPKGKTTDGTMREKCITSGHNTSPSQITISSYNVTATSDTTTSYTVDWFCIGW